MKPAPFKLVRPRDLEAACAALAEYGDEAQVLAGGQSLIPTMNFRLSQPAVLVDMARVTGLEHVELADGVLAIGAMVRQRVAEHDDTIGHGAPMVSRALPHVGHVQNRNRGTIGGSIAHADPAAELPAVVMALDAQLRLVSAAGERTVDAVDFYEGPFMTGLKEGEVLAEVRLPHRPGELVAVHEIARRHGDFAIAGVAVGVEMEEAGSTTIGRARVAAFGVSSKPVRLEEVEMLLGGGALDKELIRVAASAASTTIEHVTDDDLAGAAYRRDALGMLLARALLDAAGQHQR